MSDGLLNPEMSAENLRLHIGEMNAEQIRIARSAIGWANGKALDRIDTLTAENKRLRKAVAIIGDIARAALSEEPKP